jgi:hypothetical protein
VHPDAQHSGTHIPVVARLDEVLAELAAMVADGSAVPDADRIDRLDRLERARAAIAAA